MNSSTVIVLGVAGVALVLSIMALLKTKQKPEVSQEAIAAMGRSITAVSDRLDALYDPKTGVPHMKEYMANVKAQLDRMSLVDLLEFRRTLHPELKELYRDAVVDTVLPAVNARISMEWDKVPKAERAKMVAEAMRQARLTAAMAKDLSTVPRLGYMPKPVRATMAPVVKKITTAAPAKPVVTRTVGPKTAAPARMPARPEPMGMHAKW